MHNSYNTCVYLFVYSIALVSLSEEIIQYKVRGMIPYQNQQQRPSSHYLKSKWGMVPRIPSPTGTRPSYRPTIPLHQASYKTPVFTRPPKAPAPLIFPSAIWKTPMTVYRPPILASPTLPTVTQPQPHLQSQSQSQFYDHYHLNSIKQVGDKGPIHTIPAPNLSLADKPNVILEEPIQKPTAYQYVKEPEINGIAPQGNSLLGIQALPLIQPQIQYQQPQQQYHQQHQHQRQQQYQVTENVDVHDKLIPNPFIIPKPYYAPDPDPNNLIKLNQYPESNYLGNQYTTVPQHLQLTAQDLYQLLNGLPQQQQQQQQQFIQPNYQSQFLTTNQIPDSVNQQIKDNFNPQFHTFNYEEQNNDQQNNKAYAQSRVTADYNLKRETPETNSNSNEVALAQTQYVQQYFGTRNDNNEVDPEEQSNILTQLSSKHEISPTMFYSSLPSREAAESLANLQASGNINSNVLKLKPTPTESTKMRIYVPDEEEQEENYDDLEPQASEETSESIKKESATNYENTYDKTNINEDDYKINKPKENTNTNQVLFGSKLKIKGNISSR